MLNFTERVIQALAGEGAINTAPGIIQSYQAGRGPHWIRTERKSPTSALGKFRAPEIKVEDGPGPFEGLK